MEIYFFLEIAVKIANLGDTSLNVFPEDRNSTLLETSSLLVPFRTTSLLPRRDNHIRCYPSTLLSYPIHHAKLQNHIHQASTLRIERAQPLWPRLPQNFKANQRGITANSLRPTGVSWPSGLAYRTQVLVLAAECGFESRP